MAQYVYTMIRVGKVVPPKREILKNISLSFFPGAKIGVLGLNGSGKSTLLKIMAGLDTGHRRRSRADAGHQASASCRRSRSSIPRKTVPRRSRRASAKCCRPSRSSRRSTRPTPSRTPISTSSPPSRPSTRRSSRRRGARRRAPAGDRRRCAAPAAVGREDRQAVRRREAPRRAVQAAAVQARHAAARRADQPPRCRKRRLARAVPAALSRAPSWR